MGTAKRLALAHWMTAVLILWTTLEEMYGPQQKLILIQHGKTGLYHLVGIHPYSVEVLL
jgi:hypothetical protein